MSSSPLYPRLAQSQGKYMPSKLSYPKLQKRIELFNSANERFVLNGMYTQLLSFLGEFT